MFNQKINLNSSAGQQTYKKVYQCLSCNHWTSLADIAKKTGESYQRVKRFAETMPVEKQSNSHGKNVEYRLKKEE